MSKSNKGLKIIGDLESAYKGANRLALASVIISGLIILLMIFLYTNVIKNVIKNKMIVVVKDTETYYLPDKKAHIYGHVVNFHKLFFQIDEYNYQSNIKDATYLMSTEDGKKLYETYAANDWFKTIQLNNISVGLTVDSFIYSSIDKENDRYEVIFLGTQKIRSKDFIQHRKLVTKMKIKSITNTTKNPYGLQIYDYAILSNTTTKVTNLTGDIVEQKTDVTTEPNNQTP